MKWLALFAWFVFWFLITGILATPTVASELATFPLLKGVVWGLHFFLLMFGLRWLSQWFAKKSLALKHPGNSEETNKKKLRSMVRRDVAIFFGAFIVVGIVLVNFNKIQLQLANTFPGVIQGNGPGGYSRCIIREMPGSISETVALAHIQKCKSESPGDLNDPVLGLSGMTPADCTIKYAGQTASPTGARVISLACNHLYGFANPYRTPVSENAQGSGPAPELKPFNGKLDAPSEGLAERFLADIPPQEAASSFSHEEAKKQQRATTSPPKAIHAAARIPPRNCISVATARTMTADAIIRSRREVCP